jgi:hypothetical protein
MRGHQFLIGEPRCLALITFTTAGSLGYFDL